MTVARKEQSTKTETYRSYIRWLVDEKRLIIRQLAVNDGKEMGPAVHEHDTGGSPAHRPHKLACPGTLIGRGAAEVNEGAARGVRRAKIASTNPLALIRSWPRNRVKT